MRAFVFMFLIGCTGHGEGGQMDPPDISFGCEPSEACTPGDSCSIEGIAACNGAPISGGCDCTDGGTWACFSSCPAGCPPELPADGDACAVDGSAVCPYNDPPFSPNRIECRCTTAGFDCT